MSLVCVGDLDLLSEKTLIYFCSAIALETLPGSWVYYVPPSFSEMVQDLRRADIQRFPVVCYDSENMRLASKAYWVFKALGYEALVLYGGTCACEEEEVELADSPPEKMHVTQDVKSIDYQILLSSDFQSVVIKELPFCVYEVIGRDITQEKVKKLLAAHKISYGCDCVVSGFDAAVFGVMLSYIGQTGVKVFLGEWAESTDLMEKLTSHMGTFYSATGTVYFDALSRNIEPEIKREESKNTENTPEEIEVTHYNIPVANVKPNDSSQPLSQDNDHCNCILI